MVEETVWVTSVSVEVVMVRELRVASFSGASDSFRA